MRWPEPAAVIVLSLVLSAHCSAIVLAVRAPVGDAGIVTQPTIRGIVIPAPPAEVVQAPSRREKPVDAKPLEPERPYREPPPEPELEFGPEPERLPALPTSETAIATPPEPAEPEPVAAMPPSVSAAEDNDALGAPVTPPLAHADQFDNPAPAYPAESRRRREQGTVWLDVLILPDGTVGEVRVRESTGFERLDRTAVEAVQQWRYEPARRGREPIHYWYVQPLHFVLR
jgi:protein TonB